MFYDKGPKVNMLYYELKHDEIRRRFKTIEGSYWEINKLFDLPETKETNFAILSVYNPMVKSVGKLITTVGYALEQFALYKHSMGKEMIREASASKICKKDLSKVVNCEWTRQVGIVCARVGALDTMIHSLEGFARTADYFVGDLRKGLSCQEESLKKIEERLDAYSKSFGKLRKELKYFIKKKSKLDHGFVIANLQSIKTRIAGIAPELADESRQLFNLHHWLNLRNAKSEEKGKELEKKLKKINAMQKKCIANGKKHAKLMTMHGTIEPQAIKLPRS